MKINRLSVKDFGPIKNADIDIHPLTIFTGHNNSGKSFSALLIHCLLNSFSDFNLVEKRIIHTKSVNLFLKNNNGVFKEFKDSITNYIDLKPKFSDKPFSFPKEKFNDILKESFTKVYAEIIDDKVKNTFSNNLDKLNRLKKYNFSFDFNNSLFVNKSNKLKIENYSFDYDLFKGSDLLNDDDDSICKVYFDDKNLLINLDYILWIHNFGNANSVCEIIYMMIIIELMDILKEKSYYISAKGNELLKDLGNNISDNLNAKTGSNDIEKELLANLVDIDRDTTQSPFFNLAEKLENEVLSGNILLKEGEVKDEIVFFDPEYGLEMELNLTSASVRQLVPLILYLKYILQKGDTLIIEELENHIHPKHQLILVKYLVLAINNGLNLIITTHSDYIVEKFNNFIRLGNTADAEIFDQLGYDDSNILDYKDVAIYNFKKESDYAYVSEKIDINQTGFDIDSFYEVITELYGESTDIIDAKRI